MQFLGVTAAEWPSGKLLLDIEKAGREFNEGVGGAPDILLTSRKFKQAMAVAAQQQATAQAAAMTQAGAASAKDLGNASLAPGSGSVRWWARRGGGPQ